MPPKSSSSHQEQIALKLKADTFYKNQQFQQAIEVYTQAINADPSCEAAAALFSNRSLCNHKVNNFEEALNDGISATSIRPDWSRGYLRVATAAESLQKNEQALEAYEKYFELENNSEIKEKYMSLFKRNLEKSSSMKSQDELKLLGNDYVSKQKYDEALLVYTAAIDLDPSVESAAAIYSNRSLCYFNLQKFQEAYDDGSMASILRPEWPRGWMRRASAAVKIENYEDAHECYKKYFELDPENAKQDEISAKNFSLMKKRIQQKDKEKKMKEARLNQIRSDLLSINSRAVREMAATSKLLSVLQSDADEMLQVFDADLARVAIECGANLKNFKSDSELSGTLNPDNKECLRSFLGSVYLTRMSRRLLPAELAKLDDLISFVISEMVRRNIPIPRAVLAPACTTLLSGDGEDDDDVAFFVAPNANNIMALLRTGQVDPNIQGLNEEVPLMSLVKCSYRLTPEGNVHPQVMASMEALLTWKGINVNATSLDEDNGIKTPLCVVKHPDVAKLLLRHGADVNAEGTRGDDFMKTKTNALDCVAIDHGNPHQPELLRVLIGAGARLITDGKDGNSSSTLFYVFKSSVRTKKPISEEALQILIQLNKKQGLFMGYDGPDEKISQSLLATAVLTGASRRIVELICGMDPSSINGYSKANINSSRGEHWLTPLEFVGMSVAQEWSSRSNVASMFRILLEQGADPLLPSRFFKSDFPTVFASVKFHLVFDLLLAQQFDEIIKEKFGQKYFEKCLNTCKK